jgi:nucleotide-binding universal stress UspA family protein
MAANDFRHILVPTDGSELSRRAAEGAVALARALGAQVTFFHAKPEPMQSFFGGEGGGFVDQATPEDFAEQAQRAAENYLGDLTRLAEAAGVPCGRATSDQGTPYEAIIEAATSHGCDLIVMASHGRRGITSLILGSETHKVLTHSKIPVLVYR